MKNAGRNAYAAGVSIATQEARPPKPTAGSGVIAPNPALLGEPKSMKQSELSDFTFAGECPWRDDKTLRELYVDQGLTQTEVADRLGCSQRTVCVWLARHGIPTQRGVKKPPAGLENGEVLEELYVDRGKSSREIAGLYDCSKSTVVRWLSIHDIDLHYPAGNQPAWELQKPDLLHDLYVNRDLTSVEVGAFFGCSGVTVRKYLRRYDIELDRSPVGLGGEDHWNWRGGYSKWYGSNWRSQRRKVLRRDGGRCVRCGMSTPDHLERHGSELHVHHIVPKRTFKTEEEANGLVNLILLCQKCHVALEGLPIDNRDRDARIRAEANAVATPETDP